MGSVLQLEDPSNLQKDPYPSLCEPAPTTQIIYSPPAPPDPQHATAPALRDKYPQGSYQQTASQLNPPHQGSYQSQTVSVSAFLLPSCFCHSNSHFNPTPLFSP